VTADSIARIETFPLAVPFRPGPGEPPRAPVVSLLVKVVTAGGAEGWGEAFAFEGAGVARRAVHDLVEPLCAGRDPSQPGPLMGEVQRKLMIFGRGGAVMHAVSAVDTALWDLKGRAAGLPLRDLLGGGPASLPAYASLDLYHGDTPAVRGAAGRALGDGFAGVKLHERDPAVVRAAREEAGPGTSLMLDVNCPWTYREALDAAALLRESRLRWLEEPVWPPEDAGTLARLRAACGIPLAAGENAGTPTELAALAGAVDYLQPSPAKMGGVTALRDVFAAAPALGAAVVPHTFYHGPALLAALHVTAALGGPDALAEWRYSALEALPYGDALLPSDGRLELPPGPGLGLDPDPDVLKRYAA
jgi:L-alanine-DL-glutamate epimerase-like enolase superfamily enzyme